MDVVVVGAGIAGLGAAWELRKGGHDITLIEKNEDAGGRCRSFQWHGGWEHRGAFAFIRSEDNLIALARELDIYDESKIRDMTAAHQERILYKRKKVLDLKSFSWVDILRMDGIPVKEKLALARVLPKLARQKLRNDSRDLTTAVALDTANACDYFRKYSPRFVDYVLEPSMSVFCGYGEDDFSLAWLVWLMSGGYEWAHGWWTFKPRGVGQLTASLGERLAADPACDLRLAAEARAARYDGNGVEVEYEQAGRATTVRADAMVMAVEGSLVSGLMPGLDPSRRGFFDRVGYVGHHVARWLTDLPAEGSEWGVVLPTVDGFKSASTVAVIPRRDGRAQVATEIKGKRCAELAEASDEEILADAWKDCVEAIPELASVAIHDTHLQRNPRAICRREVGYVRRLADFRALEPLERVAFAGDYMINSTVGQAHWSGMQAAEQLTERAGTP